MAGEAALPVSAHVVRREEFARIARSRDILAEAEAEAESLASRGRAEAEAERRRGHAEGLREGRLQSARVLAQAARDAEDFLREREADLVDLVFAVAFRLVGAMPAKERMTGLVATALAEYRADLPMTLRTDPDGAAPLRQVVQELGLGQRVHVETGLGMEAGRCMLVHAGGQARIGLVDQFRAMMQDAGTNGTGTGGAEASGAGPGGAAP